MYRIHIISIKMTSFQKQYCEGSLFEQRVNLDHIDVLVVTEVFNISVQHGSISTVCALGNQSLRNLSQRFTLPIPSYFKL